MDPFTVLSHDCPKEVPLTDPFTVIAMKSAPSGVIWKSSTSPLWCLKIFNALMDRTLLFSCSPFCVPSRRCCCRKMKIIHAVLVFSLVPRCIDGSRLKVVSAHDSDDHMQNNSAKSIDEHEGSRNIYVDEACLEFDKEIPIGSGWLHSDCVMVWSQWADTLDGFEYQSYSYRDIFNETARDMRQQGNPCLVDSFRYPDGVGSSSIRLLATWMFAEEMNCDWITPESPRSSIDENGTSLYCHSLVTGAGHEPDSLDQAFDLKSGSWRCEVTNWLRFFRYDAHGVDWEKNGTIRTIHVRCDCILCYER